jgi:hypothetical protein
MEITNPYGLKKYIPEHIKRTIRQECGFGCAYCGGAVVEYHHFDPPFVDAHEHRPEGIILLCPTCHIKFGHMPAEHMRKYRQSPRCRKDGFTHDEFLFRFDKVPKVELGQITATSGQIIRYGDRVLLGLAQPEEKGGPLRFTCELMDNRNMPMLRILNNELTIGVDQFDVKLEKKGLLIRQRLKNISLQMTTNRLDEVCITHLETTVAGGTISCNPAQGLSIQAPSGGQVSVRGAIIGVIGVWITDAGLCLLGGGPSTAAGVAQRWA